MNPTSITILLLLAASAALGQEPERLTLAEAEAMALANRPALTAARFTALAAREVPAQTNAARYPTLTAGLTGAGAPDNSRLAAGTLNNPIIYSRLASGVQFNQLLTDFGRTSHLVESAKFTAGAASEDANAVRNRIVLEVDRAFFTALRSEAVLRVAEETVKARQLVVDQVTELEKARLKSGLDTSFATVSLEEARLLLVAAQNERKAAYASLSAALGLDVAREFDLVEEAFLIEPLAASELIGAALRNRPDLRARSLEIEAAGRFAKAERALKYPSISAMGAAGLLPGHSSALRGNYSAAGINVSLPFLNGGLFNARESEARMRHRAAQEREKEMQIEIVRDVNLALLNVNTAAERVEVTARLQEQGALALDLAQARYDLGLSSIVELSQAQLAQTSAAIQNVNAKYEYQIQRATLNFQIGAQP